MPCSPWTLTRLERWTATALLVAVLSACGGGGDSAPVMAPAMPPVVAAPTYSTTLEAEERDAFNQLNNVIGHLQVVGTPGFTGVGPLGTSLMVVVREGQTLQITQASMVNQATQAAVTLRPATTTANDPNGRNNGVAFSRLLTFTTGS